MSHYSDNRAVDDSNSKDYNWSHIDSSVKRLRATFATGRTRSYKWRKSQLVALDRMMSENWEEIAEAVEEDLGRPPMESAIADYYTVIGDILHTRRKLRSWMSRERVTGIPIEYRPAHAWIQPEPYGTVLIIGPWNFPICLTLDPVIAAIAAGNTVILKPSEHAPRSSSLMVRLVSMYLDEDAVVVVEGDGEVTQRLLSYGLDKVFFTGGGEVGKKILQGAAPHLTPVALELGGKSPVFVSADADLKSAARRIAYAKQFNSGQICIAPDYILAEESIKDELVDLIIDAWRDFSNGSTSPLPIINERQFYRLSSVISETSGEVVFGGRSIRESLSIDPTIVINPPLDDPVMDSEIFGPILPVISVVDERHASDIVNRGAKPLTCYVFTNSMELANRFLSGVPSGSASVNQLLFHFACPTLPFGGVGDSGMGAYHGEMGFREFSHRKSVFVKKTHWDYWFVFPPYSAKNLLVLRSLMGLKYRVSRLVLKLSRK